MIKKLDIHQILKRYGIILLLVVLVIICSFLSDSFLTLTNLFNILKQISVILMIAYGECLVIIAGQTDLSPGSVLCVSGVLAAMTFVSTGSLALSIIVSVLAGAAAGVFNGFFITRYALPPFIVTLAMQFMARGLALYVSNGAPVVIEGDAFKQLGQGQFLGIPNVVFLAAVLFVVAWFLLNRTAYGRYIYAVGGNEEAARASGVNVNRVKVIAFMLCGALSGLAGFALMSRMNVGQPNAGVNYEFEAIIGVILGGASFSGGVGTMFGSVVGCVIVGVLSNVLNLLNVSAYVQQIVKGLLILIAVVADAKSKGIGVGSFSRWLGRNRKLGGEAYDVRALAGMAVQAWNAVCARLSQGANRLIFYEDMETCQQHAILNDAMLTELRNSMDACEPQRLELMTNRILSAIIHARLTDSDRLHEIDRFLSVFFEHLSTEIGGDEAEPLRAVRIRLAGCTDYQEICSVVGDAVNRAYAQYLEQIQMKTMRPIHQAQQYIEAHLDGELTLEQVAAQIFLNPVYFSVIFKNETGVNFSKYVVAARIARAKELLRDPGLNIAEVAAQVGYKNHKHFTKLFKKVTGITPSEYRKLHL